MDVDPRRLSHGFKVGIGTVAIAALYERLLERDLSDLDIDSVVAAWPARDAMETEVRRLHPDPRLVEETVVQALTKWLPPEQLRARLELLASVWSDVSVRLRNQLLPRQRAAGDAARRRRPRPPTGHRLGLGKVPGHLYPRPDDPQALHRPGSRTGNRPPGRFGG